MTLLVEVGTVEPGVILCLIMVILVKVRGGALLCHGKARVETVECAL